MTISSPLRRGMAISSLRKRGWPNRPIGRKLPPTHLEGRDDNLLRKEMATSPLRSEMATSL